MSVNPQIPHGMTAQVEKDLRICQREIAALKGVVTATVIQLGGIVEGLPTGRHNFLQRIRELRHIEQRYLRLREHCQELVASWRRRTDGYSTWDDAADELSLASKPFNDYEQEPSE